MPWIRTKHTVLLVGTAMGIAVAAPSAQAEPRGTDEARLILAQAQPEQTEEERKKRRQEGGGERRGGGGEERRGGQGGGGQGGGGGQERRGNPEQQQKSGQGGGGGQGEERRQRAQPDGGGGQGQERRQRAQPDGDGGQGQERRQRAQPDGGGGQGQERRQRAQPDGGGDTPRQGQGQGQGENRAKALREQIEEQKRERAKQENDGPPRRQLQGEGQGQGGKQRDQAEDRQDRRQQGGGQQNQQGEERQRAQREKEEIERRQRAGQQNGGPGPERRTLQGQDRGQGPGGDRREGGRPDGRPGPGGGQGQAGGEAEPRRTLTNEQMQERRRDRREFSREKLKDITGQRRELREEGGRVVIEEPGNRRIERAKGRVIIRHDETERFRGGARDFRVERGEGGRNRDIVTRANGVQIISIKDENGRLIRRIKRLPNGREVILINNEFRRGGRSYRDRYDDDRRGGGFGFYINLPEPVINISRDEYYLDAEEASEDQIEEALMAEPIDDVEGDYTLDEIRYSDSLRKRLRRVNLNSINFEFGSWEVREDQVGNLQEVADVIKRILDRKPGEVFLIAGHTDAVGSDEDNLSLSDRRAETVARVLTDEFGVPPENLVTQGYGEQDLYVPTQGPEIRNRRVEFMRITPFLAQKEE